MVHISGLWEEAFTVQNVSAGGDHGLSRKSRDRDSWIRVS